MNITGRKSYGYLALMVMISACVVFGVGYAEFPVPATSASSTSVTEPKIRLPQL